MLKPNITVCELLSIGDTTGKGGEPLTTIALSRGRRRYVHFVAEPEVLEELAGILLRQAEWMRDPLAPDAGRANRKDPKIRVGRWAR